MDKKQFSLEFHKKTNYDIGISPKTISYIFRGAYQSFVLRELGDKNAEYNIGYIVDKLNEMENSNSSYSKVKFVIKNMCKKKYIGVDEGIGFYNQKFSI